MEQAKDISKLSFHILLNLIFFNLINTTRKFVEPRPRHSRVCSVRICGFGTRKSHWQHLGRGQNLRKRASGAKLLHLTLQLCSPPSQIISVGNIEKKRHTTTTTLGKQSKPPQCLENKNSFHDQECLNHLFNFSNKVFRGEIEMILTELME